MVYIYIDISIYRESTHLSMSTLTDFIHDSSEQQANPENNPSPFTHALAHAREASEELGIRVPSPVTLDLLGTLASLSAGGSAIAMTHASATVGLYILRGLGSKGFLTMIEPEAEIQKLAKSTFKAAGIQSSNYRFLSTRRLDLLDRLADNSYGLIYGDIAPSELINFIKSTWSLLKPGGVLILENALLDGTITDTSRKDRTTQAAREAHDYISSIKDASITRLPLGSGIVLITKLTDSLS